MRYSYVTYTGDGSNRVFSVPFDYISRDHVSVTVDGAPASFTWDTDSSIRLATAPPNGARVTVKRTTPKDTALADFQDASVLTETALDLATKQNLLIAQEADDKAEDIKQEAVDAAIEAAGAVARAIPDASASDVGKLLIARTNNDFGWSSGLTFNEATGVLSLGKVTITAGDPTGANDLARKAYVDAQVGGRVAKTGDTMTGELAVPRIRGGAGDAGTLKCWGTGNNVNFRWDSSRLLFRVDEEVEKAIATTDDLGSRVSKSGDTMTGELAVPRIKGGAGDAGTLKCWGTNNSVNFRWDGGYLHYRVDEVLQKAIATTDDVNARATWDAVNQRVSKFGDTMSGNLGIVGSFPGITLTYPGVFAWNFHTSNNNDLVFVNADTGTPLVSFTPNGRIWHRASDGGANGFSMVCADGRIGRWVWAAGNYLETTIDGNAVGINTFSSDERLKTDICPTTEDILPLIRQIEFINFRYKPLPGDDPNAEKPLLVGGVSANQLLQLKADWVFKLSDGTLALNAQLLLTNALKAIQELDAEVQRLRAKVTELEAKTAK